MNKFKILVSALLLVGTQMCFYSCSESDEVLEDLEQVEGMKTCPLSLKVDLNKFDQKNSRAENSTWKNGDKIYIRFGQDSYGVAEYNESSKLWSISYFGELVSNKATTCTLSYFENPEYVQSAVVKPSPETAIYEDSKATYTFDGVSLAITGSVAPKTGRIRFAGTANSKVLVEGISTYNNYSVTAGEYVTTRYPVTLTVGSDGYTPYIYGVFSDADHPRINVITKENGFTRNLSKNVFTKGTSGWLTVPTESSHVSWMNQLIFKVDTVSFTMLPVVKYDVNAEKTDSTRRVYFMGQTEVTQELYYTTIALPQSSSYSRHTPYSATYTNRSYSESFVEKIELITGLHFRFPSKDEWRYAAQGGLKSKGYVYSGSNIANEVAWYKLNSENKMQPVGTLSPNELGFYDMSGNVCEWTSTKESSNYFYFCGGSYECEEERVTVNSINYSTNYEVGIRLTLSENLE